MANIELNFKCNSLDGSLVRTEASMSTSERPGEVWVCIIDRLGDSHEVYLDESTSIKFAKTLRTEINKIKE